MSVDQSTHGSGSCAKSPSDRSMTCVNLSGGVSKALNQSTSLSNFIQEHQPTSGIESSGRVHVAVALFSIALHHREAALLLATVDAWPSVHALQRSIWEAFVRGYHAVYCLSEEQHNRMVQHRASPTMETVVKELRELGGHHRAFSESKSLLWESMSDYTHGGARQIARWLRTDTIEPQFTDEEKIDCLWLGDLHGLYASTLHATDSRASKPMKIRIMFST